MDKENYTCVLDHALEEGPPREYWDAKFTFEHYQAKAKHWTMSCPPTRRIPR